MSKKLRQEDIENLLHLAEARSNSLGPIYTEEEAANQIASFGDVDPDLARQLVRDYANGNLNSDEVDLMHANREISEEETRLFFMDRPARALYHLNRFASGVLNWSRDSMPLEMRRAKLNKKLDLFIQEGTRSISDQLAKGLVEHLLVHERNYEVRIFKDEDSQFGFPIDLGTIALRKKDSALPWSIANLPRLGGYTWDVVVAPTYSGKIDVRSRENPESKELASRVQEYISSQ